MRFAPAAIVLLSFFLAACPDDEDSADSNAGEECAINSAWPCACDDFKTGCEDGSTCVYVKGLGSTSLGYCTPLCDPKAPECPATEYPGSAECATKGSHGMYCILTCESAVDCPPGQDCIPVSGGSVCYPQ